MLIIRSNQQLVDSMRLAKETGTEDQLIRWLLYLDEWHGKEQTEVWLVKDIPSSPSFMSWMAFHIDPTTREPLKEAFYNGGLVYHESSNEWSVHS